MKYLLLLLLFSFNASAEFSLGVGSEYIKHRTWDIGEFASPLPAIYGSYYFDNGIGLKYMYGRGDWSLNKADAGPEYENYKLKIAYLTRASIHFKHDLTDSLAVDLSYGYSGYSNPGKLCDTCFQWEDHDYDWSMSAGLIYSITKRHGVNFYGIRHYEKYKVKKGVPKGYETTYSLGLFYQYTF